VNTFLNENQKELFNEYKTDIFNQIGGMVKTIVNGAIINFPVEKFIQSRKQT